MVKPKLNEGFCIVSGMHFDYRLGSIAFKLKRIFNGSNIVSETG